MDKILCYTLTLGRLQLSPVSTTLLSEKIRCAQPKLRKIRMLIRLTRRDAEWTPQPGQTDSPPTVSIGRAVGKPVSRGVSAVQHAMVHEMGWRLRLTLRAA